MGSSPTKIIRNLPKGVFKGEGKPIPWIEQLTPFLEQNNRTNFLACKKDAGKFAQCLRNELDYPSSPLSQHLKRQFFIENQHETGYYTAMPSFRDMNNENAEFMRSTWKKYSEDTTTWDFNQQIFNQEIAQLLPSKLSAQIVPLSEYPLMVKFYWDYVPAKEIKN